jgi:hypothetical protein
MKRRIAARAAQSTASGTPIKYKPIPTPRPKGKIHKGLHHEIATYTFRRLVKGLGSERQVSVTDYADQSIAKVLALQQHEDYKNNHQPGTGN